MTDDEAIARYDEAGAAAGRRLGPVRWPDLALDPAGVERLAEGVLASRLDLPSRAFGPDFDGAACGDRIAEAWRTEACEARFAPEGVFVRAAFTVVVTLAEDEPGGGVMAEETLAIRCEVCLSFVERRHTRPYVDFMGGEVRRASDGAVGRLDPCAFMVDPADAVAWGLNGAAPD
jgi:hypothetical protein